MLVSKPIRDSAKEKISTVLQAVDARELSPITASESLPPARKIIAESISELLSTLSKHTSTLPEIRRTHADLPKGNAWKIKPSTYSSKRISAFIQKIGDSAIAVAKKTGLPVELILSQAALESGWGQREILRPDGTTSHNLFGIKPGRYWAGPVVQIITTEYVNGVPRKVEQPFRSYVSYEDALHDYARLLSTSSRYKAVRHAPTPQRAAIEVQKAGYATDPKYAEKLITIMAQFDCPNYSQATPTNAAT